MSLTTCQAILQKGRVIDMSPKDIPPCHASLQSVACMCNMLRSEGFQLPREKSRAPTFSAFPCCLII